jgi:hypothetical protein
VEKNISFLFYFKKKKVNESSSLDAKKASLALELHISRLGGGGRVRASSSLCGDAINPLHV